MEDLNRTYILESVKKARELAKKKKAINMARMSNLRELKKQKLGIKIDFFNSSFF